MNSPPRRGVRAPLPPALDSDKDDTPVTGDDALGNLLSDSLRLPGDTGESVPEELNGFLEEHDFSKRSFQIKLFRYDDEDASSDSSNASFVKSWNRKIPSMEYLVRNYGPGRYKFSVHWRQSNPESGQIEPRKEMIDISISERCMAEYEEYQYMRQLAHRKAMQDKTRHMRVAKELDSTLLGDDEKRDPKVEVKEYISEITGMARELGLVRDQNNGSLLQQILAIAPIVTPLIVEYFKSQGEAVNRNQQMFNSMLTLMLGQSDKNSQQLLEIVKVSQGSGAGASSVKEFKDMLLGVVDIKEALNQKESVVDKVFTMAEAVLPQILTVMAMNAQQRANDPRVAIARTVVNTNPDFKSVMHDPEKLAEFVAKWDDVYGWRQTDGLLSVVGVERPASNPRDPAKELPVNERVEVIDGADEQVSS